MGVGENDGGDAVECGGVDAPAPTSIAAASPRRRYAAHAGLVLIVLILALFAATAACLAVVGLALTIWPAAAIAAASQGVLAEQGVRLALGLAVPLGIAASLHLSWKSYARARPHRCADFMIVALGLSLALLAGLNGLISV